MEKETKERHLQELWAFIERLKALEDCPYNSGLEEHRWRAPIGYDYPLTNVHNQLYLARMCLKELHARVAAITPTKEQR